MWGVGEESHPLSTSRAFSTQMARRGSPVASGRRPPAPSLNSLPFCAVSSGLNPGAGYVTGACVHTWGTAERGAPHSRGEPNSRSQQAIHRKAGRGFGLGQPLAEGARQVAVRNVRALPRPWEGILGKPGAGHTEQEPGRWHLDIAGSHRPEAAEASHIQFLWFAYTLQPPLDPKPAHELGRVADVIPTLRRRKLRLGDTRAAD